MPDIYFRSNLCLSLVHSFSQSGSISALRGVSSGIAFAVPPQVFIPLGTRLNRNRKGQTHDPFFRTR